MASFKDSVNRDWNIEIEPWVMKQVKARTGVDIGRFLDNELAGYLSLLKDPILFVDVLWVLVEEQADKKGITEEQFARSLGGDAGEAAVEAFEEAFGAFFFFFPRKLLNAMAAKGKAIAEKKTEQILKKIEDLHPDAPESTSSNSASSAPASSESIPAG